jgi:hypothetical protein
MLGPGDERATAAISEGVGEDRKALPRPVRQRPAAACDAFINSSSFASIAARLKPDSM